jgi:hypothetical protein
MRQARLATSKHFATREKFSADNSQCQLVEIEDGPCFPFSPLVSTVKSNSLRHQLNDIKMIQFARRHNQRIYISPTRLSQHLLFKILV